MSGIDTGVRLRAAGRFLLPALLAAGFAFRLGYGCAFPVRGEGGGLPDVDGFVALAGSFADSWSFLDREGRPSAHREPGYPLLLGTAFKVFGQRYGVLLGLNALMGTLALLMLFLVGRRLFGEGTAWIATALAAFYPPFIYYAAHPLRESVMVLAGLLSIWALLEALRLARAYAFAGAGAVNALAALTNTTFLPFGLIMAPLGLLALLRHRWRGALVFSAAYLAAFVLLYSLWPLRNYAVFGEPVLGSTAAGGSSFYTFLVIPQEIAGTPRHTELSDADPVMRASEGLDPIASDRYFWKAGLRVVAEDPVSFARLYLWRFFVDIWRVVPRSRSYDHSYGLLKWVSILTDGWILPLALVGVCLIRLRPPEMLWVYFFILSVNAVYALVLTTIRYRISVMPWAILLASFVLERLWRLCRERLEARVTS